MARKTTAADMQEMATGIGNSIRKGIDAAGPLDFQVEFVLVMADARTGAVGVFSSSSRRELARLLRQTLDHVYDDN